MVSNSPFIKIKHEKISIEPRSSGDIKIRMYCDRTLGKEEQGEVLVHDGENVERLIFQLMIVR